MGAKTSASLVFEQAKEDFSRGDFVGAREKAREAGELAPHQVTVTDHGVPGAPLYSIVLLTHQETADVREAFSRLSAYASDERYEVIVVNNGNPTASDLADRYFEAYKLVDVGFNYGCSGGRNLGAQQARGTYLIFIDDDGFIEDGAVEALIDAIETRDAVMVRGRVIPKSTSSIGAEHYDLGGEIIPAGPNAECILICQREEFLKYGGFDTLLAGHEGWALCSRLYSFHGPDAFLYTPRAVIRHDYARDADHESDKRSKFADNKAYLRAHYPLAMDLKRSFLEPGVARHEEILRLKKKVKTLNKRCKELERNCEDLELAREQAVKWERAYRKIETATFWRATAPLRKGMSFLKALGQGRKVGK